MSTTPNMDDQEWIVSQACPEHRHNQMRVFRWGPPPHHPCPNCVVKPVLQKVHTVGNLPPEPMSEERLAEIEARAKAPVTPLRVGSFENYKELVEHAPTDLQDLLAEVRRLRKCKQEDWCPGVPVACQKHIDQERQKLLDAHGVIDDLLDTREELRTQLDAAQDLLLERARQAEELLAQIERQKKERLEAVESVIRQRDAEVEKARNAEARADDFLQRLGQAVRAGQAHMAHVAELRAILERIRVARTEGGCSTGEAMSKSEAWCRNALALTPAAALELQCARRVVVEAAKAWRKVVGDDIRPHLHPAAAAHFDALVALEKLENNGPARRAAEETENGGSRS
jgi:ElaB/YqjD/DUF883 family membrane-anchored ribosome-binding protein